MVSINAKFDLLWLRVKCGLMPKRVHCTLTAARLLVAGTKPGNNLDQCLQRYLGIQPAADHMTYSNPIADPLGYLIGQAETIFNKAGFDAANGASTSSLLTVLQSNPVTGTAVVISWRKARYRWLIPSDFTGSYFKITWDEVFFPEEGDPVPVSTDKTATWTGPGDPQNEESWIVGEWNVLDPPSSPGEVRVVNVRYECYRSPFGNKQQTTGETYQAPG